MAKFSQLKIFVKNLAAEDHKFSKKSAGREGEGDPAVVAWILRVSMYHSVYIGSGNQWIEFRLGHGTGH